MTPHVSNHDNWDDCSITEAEAAIQHIAKFHATYWEKSISWVRQFKSVDFYQFQTSYFERWSPFLEKCGDKLPAKIKEIGEKLGKDINLVLNHIFGSKKTVVHGDYHRGNLFFLDTLNDGILPVVIDWQALKFGCGVFDVAFFLNSSVSPQVRQSQEKKLLRMYHQILVENGIYNYSFEQCWFDYQVSLLESLFRIVYLVGSGVLKPEIEQSYCNFGWHRICASIIDLNINELLIQLKR
jgi:aminoglycoside/choline kinase family phosphotransferase